jgi:hypothetical protein
LGGGVGAQPPAAARGVAVDHPHEVSQIGQARRARNLPVALGANNAKSSRIQIIKKVNPVK